MQELLKALVKAQLEIQPPKKDAENKHIKNKYASLDSIYQAVRIPLAENGIVITHTVDGTNGSSILVTSLVHVSGERMENRIPLFPMQSNNASQGFAGSLTYGRRYAICCLLGLPSDEDDDAQSLTPVKEVIVQAPAVLDARFRSETIKKIEDALHGNTDLLSKILAGYDVRSLQDIASTELPKILNKLATRKS